MKNERFDWLSAAQFALSLLAILGAWGLAAAAALFSLMGAGGEMALPAASLAIGVAAFSLLLFPSTVLGFLRLISSDLSARFRPGKRWRWWPTAAALLLVAIVLMGSWVASSAVGWLVLPVMHVLAVGLPIVLLVYLGMRRLPAGSAQRRWGLFDSGLTLSPLLIIVAEIAVFVVFAVVGVLLLAGQPEVRETLRGLMGHLTPEISPDEISELIGPLLLRPGFLLAIFLFVSVAVPMIEEALKPVGMWLLFGRLRRPAAGFTAGLLSGAGYAMFESLVTFNGGEQWTSVTLARMGTAAVHVTLSGLVGGALVGAWREKRYLSLGKTYLAAVAIHGTWNAMTVFLLADGLASTQGESVSYPVISSIAALAPYILVLLAVLCLGLLVGWNRRLQPQEQPNLGNEPVTPPATEDNVL
jgi:hypothetical protein